MDDIAMQKISIIGTGMTPVSEHWGASLRELATEAIHEALKQANTKHIDALYVANAFGSVFNEQSNLAPLVADYARLTGVEASTIEAGDASGGAAIRQAYLAVASGAIDTALVVGVEKATDIVGSPRVRARNVSLDADYEALHGATLPALAGLLMRRYMHEYNVDVSAFENFSINAHANGSKSRYAMYRNQIRAGSFAKAPMVADPVNLFDSAPDGDGAAAIVIAKSENGVHIAGSAGATDAYMLADREDMLLFRAVKHSVKKVLQQAQRELTDVDLFELHDAFTILSTITLESAGFAERGHGWKLAQDGTIARDGKMPISTFGGMKSRGNPAGAGGVYQAVEASLQLLGQADGNQIANAKTAMIQNIGGMANSVFTHLLVR
jgi:acetyl-CoA C-acetyltransferase